jgi:hypothetical protein
LGNPKKKLFVQVSGKRARAGANVKKFGERLRNGPRRFGLGCAKLD